MKLLDLGRKDYLETWELQKELVEKRIQNEIEDTLILVEHDPVYTVGRALTNFPPIVPVKRKDSKVFEPVPMIAIERGGKITYHGPGQLVGYPIFKLHNHDLRFFLREMENILIRTLKDKAKLPAKPCPATLELEPHQLQTGVWVHDKKIASIGIAVKHWVSYHGFALNLHTDLRFFEAISPCGFQGSIMTTLEKETGSTDDFGIKESIVGRFEMLSKSLNQHFGMNDNPAPAFI